MVWAVLRRPGFLLSSWPWCALGYTAVSVLRGDRPRPPARTPPPHEGVRAWLVLRYGESATWRDTAAMMIAIAVSAFQLVALLFPGTLLSLALSLRGGLAFYQKQSTRPGTPLPPRSPCAPAGKRLPDAESPRRRRAHPRARLGRSGERGGRPGLPAADRVPCHARRAVEVLLPAFGAALVLVIAATLLPTIVALRRDVPEALSAT